MTGLQHDIVLNKEEQGLIEKEIALYLKLNEFGA